MLALGNLAGSGTAAQADVPEIWFPVHIDDNVAWSDTWGHARGGGRTHKGVDIMAPQMQPVYASVGGWIRRAYGADDRSCLDGGYCTSYGMLIHADDGRSYFYLHLNDDTPGRPNGCDHVGGAENAYSPRLVEILRERGTLEPLPQSWDPQDVVRVETGELIGYLGSSGNAGCNIDHVHFETWEGHDFKSANDPGKDNPYPMVQAAFEAGRYWHDIGPVEPVATERLAGANRVATALEVARDGFEQATVAVIAPAAVHVEALVGAPLAAALGGPVLLHWGDFDEDAEINVDEGVVEELARLGVEDVVVLSQAGSVDPRLDAALAEAAGLDRDRVVRIEAEDRYALAALVADRLLAHHGWPTSAEANQSQPGVLGLLGGDDDDEAPQRSSIQPLLALGEHEVDDRAWPDALAASTLAAAQQVPILLTRGDQLPEATIRILEHEAFEEVRLVGGEGAISPRVEADLNNRGHLTRRLAGGNRYQTALAVSQELVAYGHVLTEIHIATGDNFPDALAAGPSVAAQGGLLLLVNGQDPEGAPAVLDWLRRRQDKVEKVTALGGERAVSETVLRTMAVHANWPEDDEES